MSKSPEHPKRLLDMWQVKAVSPDGSTTARLSRKDGMRIEFDPRAIGRHSEDSLSQQVTAAVAGTQKGQAKAFDALVQRALRRNDLEPAERGAGDSPAARRQRRVVAARDEVEVRSMSPRRLVRVLLRGDGQVRFDIAPGSLRDADVTLETLAEEACEAYQKAQRECSEAVLESRQAVLEAIKKEEKR
ncbi:MAG: hypothetical protein ACRDXX_09800 [Stackebrandtia sp.]